MSRTRYLIAYDICDPKRLRRVIKVMEGYGQRLQYSVFLCDLNKAELLSWRAEIVPELEPRQDSVVLIDLGPPGSRPMETIGTSRSLPTSGPVIV